MVAVPSSKVKMMERCRCFLARARYRCSFARKKRGVLSNNASSNSVLETVCLSYTFLSTSTLILTLLMRMEYLLEYNLEYYLNVVGKKYFSSFSLFPHFQKEFF